MLEPRWDLLEREGVNSTIEAAARNVHKARSFTTEFEDLAQDARIMVATTANLIDAIENGDTVGLLYHRLRQDLLDATETEDRNLGSRISYEHMIEGFGE